MCARIVVIVLLAALAIILLSVLNGSHPQVRRIDRTTFPLTATGTARVVQPPPFHRRGPVRTEALWHGDGR